MQRGPLGLLGAILFLGGCQGADVDPVTTDSGEATDTLFADTGADGAAVDTGADGVAADTGADSVVGDTGAPTDAGVTMVDSGVCGVHPGPAMVQIAAPKGKLCIDTREVSNAQYAEFEATPSKPALPAYCSFKTTPSPANPLPAAKDLPVVNVDWCDAVQYCAWAGKRLCGGFGGGHVVRSGTTISGYVDDSQWTAACENNAGTLYSTGDTYPGGDAGVCNITNNGGMVWSVSSGAGCKGLAPPFDQVLNLTGNAGEWEDNCTNYDTTGTPGNVVCLVRGGTPSTCCVNDFDYACRAANIITTRATRSGKIGFRCCSK